MKYTIGIDPGFTGAIAVLDCDGFCIELKDTPTREEPYKDKTRPVLYPAKIISLLAPYLGDSCVILEDVTARPKQGVVSMFRFGHGLGVWEGILSALAIPYIKVRPVDWKNYFGFKKEKKKIETLAYTRNKFPILYPYLRLSKHHNRADALCLALYGYEI